MGDGGRWISVSKFVVYVFLILCNYARRHSHRAIQRELSTLLFLQREFNTNGVYTSEGTVHVKAVLK